MQTGVGVKRRSHQLQHCRPGAVDQLGGRRRQPGLPDPRLAAKHHPRRAQRAGSRPRPTLRQPRHLAVAAHQRTAGDSGGLRPLADHLVVGDQPVHALDRSSGAALQLEGVTDQRRDRIGDHHRSRRCQTRHPRGQIRRQPVHVVLGGVQIHQPAVHPDPDRDLNPEAALGLLAEPFHRAGDLQPRQHRAPHIILMRLGMTEHRQQPVTLGGPDMPLIAVHDAQHQVAVTAHQQAVGLRLNAGR